MKQLLLRLEAIVTLAGTRLGLRLAPARVLSGVFDAPRRGRTVDREVVSSFLDATRRTPFGHTCLHRALALQRMLRRRGTMATLRIGVGRRPNLFPGHAWLEVDGTLIGDDPEIVARYVPLAISQSALHAVWQ